MNIDWTNPVETIRGYEICVLCTDASCPYGYVVCGLIKPPEGFDYLTRWKLDGTAKHNSADRAVQAPTTYYAAVYRIGSRVGISGAHIKKSDVPKNEDYIKTISFEV